MRRLTNLRKYEVAVIMRIFWITNIQFPYTSQKLGIKPEVGGGWMYSLASELVKEEGIILAIATTYNGSKLLKFQDSGIQYYLLPRERPNTHYDKSLEDHWTNVLKEYNPDIVHIHGTEYAHGLACINACPEQRYVVSIQGLISIIKDFSHSGINFWRLLRHTTLNDIKQGDTIIQAGRKLGKRGEFEIEYIRRCEHIMGRTSWDFSHTMALNYKLKYHFCNEVLRNCFYDSPRWNIDHKQSHSIFVSKAYLPRHGLQEILRALVIVKDFYPDVQLKIAGMDVTGGNRWVQRISTYGAYIRALLKELKLADHVNFLGSLSEEKMVAELRSSHVFVSSSAIDNSPNSLGEAQMIGIPCIASFVGGVPDMVRDGESGLLYVFDDHVMLAFKIISIFNDNTLALKLSKNGREAAMTRHNRNEIRSRILHIYSTIVNEGY